MAGKKYKDLMAIAYPLSNIKYVVSVNDVVLESKGEEPNPSVNINSGLEPQTAIMLDKAGLFNSANKTIK